MPPPDLLPWLERELGPDPLARLPQRNRAQEREVGPRRAEHRPFRDNLGAVLCPGVVVGGFAVEAAREHAAHGVDDPHDFVLLVVATLADRHEVDHFAHSLLAEEARDQNVRLGQVKLAVRAVVLDGDLEGAALLVVEDGPEHARGIEMRQAAPVDRPVVSHQRHRAQVTNDSVGFNGLVGHGLRRFDAGNRSLPAARANCQSRLPASPKKRQLLVQRPRCPCARLRISGARRSCQLRPCGLSDLCC